MNPTHLHLMLNHIPMVGMALGKSRRTCNQHREVGRRPLTFTPGS